MSDACPAGLFEDSGVMEVVTAVMDGTTITTAED